MRIILYIRVYNLLKAYRNKITSFIISSKRILKLYIDFKIIDIYYLIQF